MKTILTAANLEFAYPNSPPIIAQASFECRVGESIVIAGANGSGKSTLLQIAAGLLTPSRGEISVTSDGQSYSVQDSAALIMQNPDHQCLAATVEEEIALAMELRGWPQNRMRERVNSIFQQFHLDEFKDRLPQSLSGGQKQRIAIAAMCSIEPPFLMLDEPDAMLDAPSRQLLYSVLAEIRDHTGFIWSCADPDRLPDADRCYWLDHGTLSVQSRSDILEFMRRES